MGLRWSHSLASCPLGPQRRTTFSSPSALPPRALIPPYLSDHLASMASESDQMTSSLPPLPPPSSQPMRKTTLDLISQLEDLTEEPEPLPPGAHLAALLDQIDDMNGPRSKMLATFAPEYEDVSDRLRQIEVMETSGHQLTSQLYNLEQAASDRASASPLPPLTPL